MQNKTNEENAALLLASADDDAQELNQLPLTPVQSPGTFVSNRSRSNRAPRRRANNLHPIVLFILFLTAFTIGCLTGVLILLYRMSQDTGSSSSSMSAPSLTNIDLTVQKKLSESLIKTNFLNLNRTIESENDAANKLEQLWQSHSNIFTRVNKLSYDLTLSTYVSSTQWSGIQFLDKRNKNERAKFNLLATNDYLSLSSLVKAGKVDANSIYYANYGRQEDFAYLIKTAGIHFENNDRAIVFMRRKSTVISQTEQIRQAIHYGFAGLVLFDDDSETLSQATTDDRQSFSDEWRRLSTERERQRFLDGVSNDDDRQIVTLVLSYTDVEKIFSIESNSWLSCPTKWHNQTTSSFKLGGSLQQTEVHLVTFMEEVPVHLPLVLGYVRGTIDADRFIMIGYQLGRKQQEKVVNEIVKAYDSQIKDGWRPRRSIIFSAWSGVSYDRYTIRRWISDNYRLIDRNLIAYIDLGNGIVGNSTLNLHASPLFQQVVQRAADYVVSPLVHDHTCHHRQGSAMPTNAHTHQKRHSDDDHASHNSKPEQHANEEEEEEECEPHKLLDEWLRASKNRIGPNKTLSIVQMIDSDSSAALFQLQYGIPGLVIEMTDEQSLTNDTFYLKKSPPVFHNDIQPEVIAAYAQFVSEIIRQLADEPLIPFNLSDYADLIDKQTENYISHYDRQYRVLNSHLGDLSEMMKYIRDFTAAIRKLQSQIDETPKNNYVKLQVFNEKLIEFERLFIINDQLRHMNTPDETFRHIFVGPAFGLTNTVVPFPSLSNLLYGIGDKQETELRDASQLYWSRLKQNLRLITRTLSGFDGALANV